MIMLDTSVLIDLPTTWPENETYACSSIALAELQFGLQKAAGTHQHAERQARLNSLDALFEWLPFDEKAAVAYGTLATVVSQSRPNHARSKDIMMAGHAYSLGASLMTRNPNDFELVDGMISVIAV